MRSAGWLEGYCSKRKWLSLICAVMLSACPAHAEEPTPYPLKEDMSEWKKRVDAAIHAETSVLREMYRVEKTEYAFLVRMQRLERESSRIKERIRDTEAEILERNVDLEGRRDLLGMRLGYMYRMRGGHLVRMLFRSRTIPDLLRRWRAVKLIVGEDQRRIRDHQRRLKELAMTRRALSRDQRRIRSVRNEQDFTGRSARLERKKRLLLLERIRQDRRMAEKFARELETAREETAELVAGITADSVLPLPEEGEVFLDFALRRRYLSLPVAGPIIAFFGPVRNEKLGTTTRNNGLDILAAEGSPVRAVAGGIVRFAGQFMGYGRVIILDHGDRYHTMYGHLARIRCAKGEVVREGQVIASVGQTGSLSGPRLHFEIRHKGIAVNPMLWVETER